MSAGADASRDPHADVALRHSFPECALTDVFDALHGDAVATTRGLLGATRSAYSAGRRELAVPAVLTGGRLPFDARVGALRAELVGRLDRLVRVGRLRVRDAAAVRARFGLDGDVGGAPSAREATGLRRQATTDAVNRAIRVVAADISAQPLMPLEAPKLGTARRQLIVGSVLSLMHGPPERYPTRLYAQMRVRAELLGDPRFPVGPADAAERQRRRRLANRWLSIAGDHLDRDALPLDRPPPASEANYAELAAWRVAGDARTAPSVGAIRALVAGGEAAAFADAPSVQGMLGFLLDGYRPLVELLRVAHFAHATPSSAPPWNTLDNDAADALRVAAVLSVGDLLAVRGYPDAAALYAGLGRSVATDRASAAWLRFRRLMVMEGISYLRGPASVAQTREWHLALIEHLDRYGAGHHGEPLAVAHAIIRAEHVAWTAGVPSGATVDELLEPLGEALGAALNSAPPENRRRFALVRARLARALGETPSGPSGGEPAATGQPPAAAPEDGQDRYDEWYCASPIAVARWDRRGFARGEVEWRR